MDSAVQRLYSGDVSQVFFIEELIEGPQQAPTGTKGRTLYGYLASLLYREGRASLKLGGDAQHLPSPGGATSEDVERFIPAHHCVAAMRVLDNVGGRVGPDGVDCRAALLAIGLQNCRDMRLDAYFSLKGSERLHVAMFVCILTAIFGCSVCDLVRKPQNIQYVEVSSFPSLNARPGGVALSPEGRSAASGGGGGAQGGSPRPVFHLRSSVIPLRSTISVPIIGTSGFVPIGGNGRRYRALPRKPAITPYAINPLYDPNIAVDDNTLLLAQFPFPISQFSSFYGLGCVPRIPAASSFRQQQHIIAQSPGGESGEAARKRGADSALVSPVNPNLDVFESADDADSDAARGSPDLLEELLTPAQLAREAQLQAAAERIGQCAGRANGTDITSPAVAGVDEGVVAAMVWENDNGERSHRGPSQMVVPTGATTTTSGSAPKGLAGASESFTYSQSPAALALNRRCLQCSLLHEYLEEGKLLSWGDDSFHALGPPKAPPLHQPAAAAATGAGATAAASAGAITATEETPRSAVDATSSSEARGSRAPLQAAADLAGVTDYVSKLSVPAATLASSASSFVPPLRGEVSGGGSDRVSERYAYAPTAVRTPGKVVDIACGSEVTYIVTETGILCSCGRAESGQLGIGERGLHYASTGAERFQRVVLTKEEQVACVFSGAATAAAVASDGYVYCWGHNAYGQCLRQADAARVLLPVRFKTGRFKPVSFVFGNGFGGIVFDDGVVGMWGIARMLGTPITADKLEPTLVADGSWCSRRVHHLRTPFDAAVASLRAGPWHVVAITITGSVYTWGVGHGGRLGHGSDSDEAAPRKVEGLGPAMFIDAGCGPAHTALLAADGAVYVCGENKFGQLGLRGAEERRLPVRLPLPASAIAVACSRRCTFVLLETGNLVACGSATLSGAGLGAGRTFVVPTYVLPNHTTLLVSSGPSHALAAGLARTTALARVGHSSVEQLSRMESVVVRSGVRSVAAGVGFVTVLSENGSMVALGRGERGQLGTGTAMRPASPDKITVASAFESVRVPPGIEFLSVACGPDFVLALDRTARVFGWGSNAHELLGLPAGTEAVYEPTLLALYEGRRIFQIACGGSFVVALTEEGEVLTHGEYQYCGLSSAVQGPTRAANKKGVHVLRPSPVPGFKQVAVVAAGREHAVAMTAACVVYAWGKGVLGTGSAAASSIAYAPTRIALSQSIRTLGCGPDMTYAITSTGELYVWGNNEHHQCGVPTRAVSAATVATSASSTASTAAATQAGASVTVPTLVARGVRHAAFSAKFGLVVGEDGTVRACGTLRHAGRDHRLTSFDDGPQPVFAIDVNVARPSGAARGGGGAGNGAGVDSATDNDRGSNGGADSGTGNGTRRRRLAGGETFFTPRRSSLQGSRNGTMGVTTRALLHSAPPAGVGSGSTPSNITTYAAGIAGVSVSSRSRADDPLTALSSSRKVERSDTPLDSRQPRLSSSKQLSADTAAAAASGVSGATAASAASMAKAPLPEPQPSSSAGIYCFGGWEQIFAVLEKNRPTPSEVRLTHRGLRVFLRQRE